jgi:hypothetical protein
MLFMAGIDEVALAAAAREAFHVMRRNLSAKRVELVTYRGDYSKVELPDLAVNQRAAEAAFDLIGLSLSRQDSGSDGGDTIINIVFPTACQPTTPIDVKPPAQAIEAMPPEPGDKLNTTL